MTADRRRLVVCALVCAACTPAASAAAVGPPLPSADSGRAGAVAPGGTERLITRRAGADTLVTAVRRGDGRVVRSRRISGRWSIPAITLEGATTGLSADGRTLVLAQPTKDFPPASTLLAVLDTQDMLIRRRIALRGFFTVDGISPDGRSLYLIEYHGDRLLDYAVRALDTGTGRLAADAVVDPREPDEQMGGFPIARAMSRDGRWAYTLYSGSEETFIHALDTVGRTAACIDLEAIPPDSDLSAARLRLSAGGRRIDVFDGGTIVAVVNTRTFAVSEPGEANAAQPAAPGTERRAVEAPADDAAFPWPILAAGLAGLCAIVLAIAHRRAPLSR